MRVGWAFPFPPIVCSSVKSMFSFVRESSVRLPVSTYLEASDKGPNDPDLASTTCMKRCCRNAAPTGQRAQRSLAGGVPPTRSVPASRQVGTFGKMCADCREAEVQRPVVDGAVLARVPSTRGPAGAAASAREQQWHSALRVLYLKRATEAQLCYLAASRRALAIVDARDRVRSWAEAVAQLRRCDDAVTEGGTSGESPRALLEKAQTPVGSEPTVSGVSGMQHAASACEDASVWAVGNLPSSHLVADSSHVAARSVFRRWVQSYCGQ